MAEDWKGISTTLGFVKKVNGEDEGDPEAMFRYFYIDQKLTVQEISQKLGYGRATILRQFNLHKIERRSRGGANRPPEIKLVLHRLDPRIVFLCRVDYVQKQAHAQYSTVYKYKREVAGNGVLCDQSNSGAEEIRNAKSAASGSTSGN